MSTYAADARPPYAGRVLADLIPGTRARDLVLVAGGAALTGLVAQVSVSIPGTPVPVTGQTFAVLLVGAALGWRRGLASMLLYLLAGLVGVPWFAEGASGYPAVTFGYLIGFVLAGALVGALAERGGDRTVLRTVASMVLGNVVIFAVGMSWLMAALGVDLATGWRLGVAPFLVGGVVKTALAAGLLPAAWAVVRRVRGDAPD